MKLKQLLTRKDLELIFGVGTKTAGKYFRTMKQNYQVRSDKYVNINVVSDHSELTHEQIYICLNVKTTNVERKKIQERIKLTKKKGSNNG